LRRYFTPATRYCGGKYNCVIGRDSAYKLYPATPANGLNSPVAYCMKCYQEAPDEIPLGADENNKVLFSL